MIRLLQCYAIGIVPACGAAWVAVFGRSDAFSVAWMIALAIAAVLNVRSRST
jgi:hypothetical protein